MDPKNFLLEVRANAKTLSRTIVLPDANDIRTVKAARIISNEGIARPILVGTESEILNISASENISLEGIEIVEPEKHAKFGEYTSIYHELRKKKGLTLEEATSVMQKPLFFGAMMVRQGAADGSVAGSLSTTGDVLRAGLQVIGMEPGNNTVSSFFVMVFPDRLFSFADCAVVPDPTVEQLADIAITTAANHKKLTGEEPRVAMLSFSTKGSAAHEKVEKIQQATLLAQKKQPSLLLDGELQFDAALLPSVGKKKAPGSAVAGYANVFIFPDLGAGNIGYKIAQRLGGAEAAGPIVQGLAKPAFDLSRGCSVEDIVNVTAMNAVIGAS
ncbi:MAG TPA: phosphate acetyltransferase [Bacteroidota bacterium]|nr:phosphate acetyltransferase [Bacteroidota bacterium]